MMKNTAYHAGIQYLTYREHSHQELVKKLNNKGYDQQEIKTALDRLAQSGLLSNRRFAESYTNNRRRKGYGPQRITLELQDRGIPPEVIAEVLDIADNPWSNEAFQVWKKRFKGALPKDYKERAKQMRFLQYRGFTKEQIDAVFSKSTV